MTFYPSLGSPPIPNSEIQILEDLHNQLRHPIILIDDFYNTRFREQCDLSTHRLTDFLLHVGFRNFYGDLPEIFGGLGTVRNGHVMSLTLCHGNLTALPPSASHFSNLLQLSLARGKFTSLPSSLDQLTELRELYLDYNEFTEFPEVVTRIPSLNKLHLSNNHIRSIPSSINQLINLQILGLDSNEICRLPDSLGPFPRLEGLGLGMNQLESFPDLIGPYSEQGISLNLAYNQLKDLPNSLANIPYISNLFLPFNQFTRIPAVIQKIRAKSLYFYLNPQEVRTVDSGENPLQPPYNFIADRSRRLQFPIYYIRHMMDYWEGFPNNLLAMLAANRFPSHQFHQLILHSSAGGFVLQKCAEIATPAAKQYATRISEEYHRMSFGKYDLYGPI